MVSVEDIRFMTAPDDELVLISRTSAEAYGVLISRYLPSVRRLAGMYSPPSADRDDLVSEGILGLMNAVATFDPAKGASFATYASACANNRMLSALKKSARIKRREESLDSVGPSSGSSPEKIILDREALDEIFSEFSENFSEFERAVFSRYLCGEPYAEIAESLGVERKSVDNALARIRRKLRKKLG